MPWDGIKGIDVIGPEVEMPRDAVNLDSHGLEGLRIAAGWPRMGAEIDGKTTPVMTVCLAKKYSHRLESVHINHEISNM